MSAGYFEAGSKSGVFSDVMNVDQAFCRQAISGLSTIKGVVLRPCLA